jgi:N-acetylglucosaminyldiphosphoundecaprenol N-acetyl-beta-D-mannosaminyltransferase
MPQVLDVCADRIASRTPLLLGVVNVAKAVKIRKDSQLRESVCGADLVLADGAGIVLLSRLKGQPLPERVTGIDLMYNLMRLADDRHYRVYFLGAEEDVVAKVVDHAKSYYPGMAVAGYHNGYFGPDDEEHIAQDIRDSKADILFVAMTSPKKENFLSRWREVMDVPICHGVGGSFDIVAGRTQRAPIWMQNAGLEWLYRVYQEPGRMWKRYLVTNSVFFLLGTREIISARTLRLFRTPGRTKL